MGRIFPIGMVLIGTTLSGAPVAATDLKVPPLVVKSPPLVQIWSGPYVGLNIGYGWGEWDSVGTWNGLAVAPSPKVKGWFGGIQGGHNWQFDRFVLGVEADIQLSDISGSADILSVAGKPSVCTDSISAITVKCGTKTPAASQHCTPAVPGMTVSGDWNMNWFSTIRGRAGWTIDRSLLYVTAGAAIADLDQTSGGATSNKLKGGFTVGAGVEMAIARNWTAKAEYLYLDFGSTTFQGTNGSITSQVQEHAVRIGANFHFDPNFLAKH